VNQFHIANRCAQYRAEFNHESPQLAVLATAAVVSGELGIVAVKKVLTGNA
jgi:hypothetical protein